MVTPNFGHIAKLTPTAKAWYTIHEIEGTPKLEVCYAGRTNKPYFAALQKLAIARARGVKIQKGNDESLARANIEALERVMANDRVLFPKYVILGWEGVVDSAGNPVEFNSVNCAEFVAALPDWIFQRLQQFCDHAANFVDEDAPTPEDISEASKN